MGKTEQMAAGTIMRLATLGVRTAGGDLPVGGMSRLQANSRSRICRRGGRDGAGDQQPCPGGRRGPARGAAVGRAAAGGGVRRVRLGSESRHPGRRKKVEAAGERVPQAASLEDPTLSVMGYPFYPAVPQTAGGRATASVAATQAVPWFGKLDLAPKWRKRKPRWRDENWPPRN